MASAALTLLIATSSTAQDEPQPRCYGNPVTVSGSGSITGTPGRDIIRGSEGRDVIRGAGGDDAICGLGGGDRIVGGAGSDAVSAGRGRDFVVGDAATWGGDLVRGGGRDALFGGGAVDVVIGDAFSARGRAVNTGGRDSLDGGNGQRDAGQWRGDLLIGGSASRQLRLPGKDGRDTINGKNGPDLIIGDNASLRDTPHAVGSGSGDLLSGEVGHDRLVGGDGKDFCAGRKGRDSFRSCDAKPPVCPRGAVDGLRPRRRLIGLPLEEARRIARNHDGCEVRVVKRDGEPLAVTDDLRLDRINVEVQNDVVTRFFGIH